MIDSMKLSSRICVEMSVEDYEWLTDDSLLQHIRDYMGQDWEWSFSVDSMSESDIQTACRRVVEARGGRFYKWSSPGNRGVMDAIVLIPGQEPFFVEFKAAKGRPTPLQREALDWFHRHGFWAAIVSSVDEFREHLDAWLE